MKKLNLELFIRTKIGKIFIVGSVFGIIPTKLKSLSKIVQGSINFIQKWIAAGQIV